MPIHRRTFMKLLGVSVASLYLTRCRLKTTQPTPGPDDFPGCYEPAAPPEIDTPEPTNVPARERLRLYWLRFDELAQNSREDTDGKLRDELTNGHFAVLDELVASEEISGPVANLVQEAYEAAVYHVWRSNVPITCYKTVAVDYAPSSAAVLVEQSQVLNQIAQEGTIDPDTLAKARAALEHDLAFYALSEEEVQALYDQLSSETGQYPSFDELSLELTPEAREATQFIINLLTNK